MVGIGLMAVGCSKEGWLGFRKVIPHTFEPHTETEKWRAEQTRALETYAANDDGETYRVPVSVAMAAVAADPQLLAPVVELKTDLSGLSLAEKGEQYFKVSYACAGCHSLEGARLVGPPLNARWGGQALLEGDGEVTFDDAYFRESVFYSRKQIARGYPPAMPVFEGMISEEEFQAIMAFVKTYQD